ncbi:MAG: zinc ABC transporter substrate-binding protein [Phycisphaerales bacterium]|nr:MAG: zinc ABC transporter substrate-binding protein [Phycisphaerales bacterium]
MERACRGAIAICLLVMSLAGCQKQPLPEQDAGRVPVVVSVLPQKWLVDRIGGDHVEVLAIVSGGESPATYQPTDVQVTALMKAKAYFRIGVPFENGPWFSAIRQARSLRIVDVRNGITLRQIDEHDHGEEEHDHAAGGDPHIWLSPGLLKIQARTVSETLNDLDPDRRADYERNLRQLEAELDELDAVLRAKLEPVRGRMFFVFHPAWGYFADEYGLKQLAVEIEGKEPGDADLTRLQREAREAGARVLFVQRQISARSAEAVAQAIGGRVEVLDPLAADVPANLLRVAEALRAAYSDAGEPDFRSERD